MRYAALLMLCLTFALSSCGSTRQASDEDTVKRAIANERGSNVVEVNAAETGTDLTTYLRRVAGVSVRGDGPGATVRVRGDMNFQGDATPLFVVDGTILGNDFASVFSTVDVNDIKRVRVLKNISDTNRYGMQGANGVIEIKLK